MNEEEKIKNLPARTAHIGSKVVSSLVVYHNV